MRRRISRLWIAAGILLAAASAANAQSVELPPLNTLGAGKYQGFVGGLYADGQNEPPPAHAAALARISRQIQPLDSIGQPAATGKIVVAGVGASVCRQIFAELESIGPQAAR